MCSLHKHHFSHGPRRRLHSNKASHAAGQHLSVCPLEQWLSNGGTRTPRASTAGGYSENVKKKKYSNFIFPVSKFQFWALDPHTLFMFILVVTFKGVLSAETVS